MESINHKIQKEKKVCLSVIYLLEPILSMDLYVVLLLSWHSPNQNAYYVHLTINEVMKPNKLVCHLETKH